MRCHAMRLDVPRGTNFIAIHLRSGRRSSAPQKCLGGRCRCFPPVLLERHVFFLKLRPFSNGKDVFVLSFSYILLHFGIFAAYLLHFAAKNGAKLGQTWYIVHIVHLPCGSQGFPGTGQIAYDPSRHGADELEAMVFSMAGMVTVFSPTKKNINDYMVQLYGLLYGFQNSDGSHHWFKSPEANTPNTGFSWPNPLPERYRKIISPLSNLVIWGIASCGADCWFQPNHGSIRYAAGLRAGCVFLFPCFPSRWDKNGQGYLSGFQDVSGKPLTIGLLPNHRIAWYPGSPLPVGYTHSIPPLFGFSTRKIGNGSHPHWSAGTGFPGMCADSWKGCGSQSPVNGAWW